MVKAPPSPPFEMPEPDFLLEFLVVAFDPPTELGNINELTERDFFRKRRQPIFDRLVLAIGPFDQQPLLRPTFLRASNRDARLERAHGQSARITSRPWLRAR